MTRKAFMRIGQMQKLFLNGSLTQILQMTRRYPVQNIFDFYRIAIKVTGVP
jgi:hypothetical protein